MERLGFSAALLKQITPFATPDKPPHARQNNFKGLNKQEVAAKVGKMAPVPEISKTDADICDGAVFSKILGDARDLWNRLRQPGVPAFIALTSGWQTVWLSRVYQEGPGPKNPQAIAFRLTAAAGKWQEAITILRSYKKYRERTVQEAALLTKELPPAIPPLPSGIKPTR